MHKYMRRTLLAMPILSIALSTTAYLAIATNSDQNEYHTTNYQPSEVAHSANDETFNVFPDLRQEHNNFYQYINVRSGEPYFSDNFVARVVNHVVANMIVVDGTVTWGYYFDNPLSRVSLVMKFVWHPPLASRLNEVVSQYRFTLTH